MRSTIFSSRLVDLASQCSISDNAANKMTPEIAHANTTVLPPRLGSPWRHKQSARQADLSEELYLGSASTGGLERTGQRGMRQPFFAAPPFDCFWHWNSEGKVHVLMQTDVLGKMCRENTELV